jgi:type IV secretion system protein VirB11
MSVTLDHLLEPYDRWLDDPTVEDICVQEAGVGWIYRLGRFERHELKVDAETIEDLAIVAAAQMEQDVGNGSPLLKTDLVGRGRIAVVLRPSALFPCLAIRRGSDEWPTLAGLVKGGLFKNARRGRPPPTENDAKLMAYYRAEAWEEFFALAIPMKKNIIAAGPNGSGKTHFSKSLIDSIPIEERLVTIENAPELRGLRHPNRVQLFVDSGSKTGPGPSDLVEIALRLRIGRLFLQELLSGEDVLGYLLAAQTGHRGAITTIHARTCAAVFDRMRVLIKLAAGGGAAISDADLNTELKDLVDIVVHFSERNEGGFSVDEVYFRDAEQ